MAFLKKNGRYGVIGLGASGLSAVRYLHKLGHNVFVCDQNPSPPLANQLPSDVACDFGRLDAALLQSADGIVISPGVDPRHPSIVATKQTIPVVSDIQLFADECHKRGIKMVAITGSNAKSTVTTLVYELLCQAGVSVGVGGNIGTPALDLLGNAMDVAVLELSSFQLEGVTALGAYVATILNICDDHLDRHETMANYINAKVRIFDQAEHLVLPLEDTPKNPYPPSKNAPIYISEQKPLAGQFGLVEEDGDWYLAVGDKKLLSAKDLAIKGRHNLINALFALAIGYALGLAMPTMLKTLHHFKGLPHRCQFVKHVDGCDYFNDSKGTNIGATLANLQGLGAVYGRQSIVLILGGQSKGQHFALMHQAVDTYAHTVLTIGADAAQIERELGTNRPLVSCGTLAKAVSYAHHLSAPCVLLSPACASFDQFSGFAERGDCFVAQVATL